MPIFQKGKSKYITSPLDGKDYNITTGHFSRYLDSMGFPIEFFVTTHLGVTRDACQCCGKPAVFKGTEDLQWKWLTTCGEKECAIELRRRGRKAVTKEQEAESVRKRNETFENNPKLLKNRSRLAHEANTKVGQDGLTGYERTKKRREETLLEKHGRKDFANWDKSAETWNQKSYEEIKEHGDKIRSSWEAKPDDVKRDEIDRREAAKLSKYGLPGWKIAFNASRGRRSKLSDNFCDAVQSKVNEQLVYGTKELNLQNHFYDLTSTSTKKIIEFNGDYWHANPLKYAHNENISLKGNRTAKEIWESDARKIALAESHGYKVKVIWESDYKKNPTKIIEECVTWLSS